MFIRLSSVQPSVPVVVKRSIYQQVDLYPIPDASEADDVFDPNNNNSAS